MKGKILEYKINLQYKDRLFCFLFGNEKYKKYALSLYNALNGVDYQDESENRESSNGLLLL